MRLYYFKIKNLKTGKIRKISIEADDLDEAKERLGKDKDYSILEFLGNKNA